MVSGFALASAINARAVRALTLLLITRSCGNCASGATGTMSLSVSTGSFLSIARLMVMAPWAGARRVWRSGSALAPCRSATLPPAPVRFSTTSGTPVCLPSQSPTIRPRRSVAAPAATGTTIRIGFDERLCADAGITPDANMIAPKIACTRFMSPVFLAGFILEQFARRVLSTATSLYLCHDGISAGQDRRFSRGQGPRIQGRNQDRRGVPGERQALCNRQSLRPQGRLDLRWRPRRQRQGGSLPLAQLAVRPRHRTASPRPQRTAADLRREA